MWMARQQIDVRLPLELVELLDRQEAVDDAHPALDHRACRSLRRGTLLRMVSRRCG